MNRDHKLDLLDMPEMLGVLFDDVDHAQERIDIECYIFSSDEFGKDFAERMCKAKGRGVKTRALYDPLGSQKAEEKFFEEMCGSRFSGTGQACEPDSEPLLGRGHSDRCSTRMHRSMTTSRPASRARAAAASLTTPNCIHTT